MDLEPRATALGFGDGELSRVRQRDFLVLVIPLPNIRKTREQAFHEET